jgi:hypothetical protein
MGQPFFLTSIICATLEDLSCTSKQRLNSVLMDPVRIVGLRIRADRRETQWMNRRQ